MNNEIKNICTIPSSKGFIENPGWARCEYMKYKRENIKAPWFRKKEWDYYLFTNDKVGVAFTISDLGYVGLLSVSFLDFEKGWEITDSEIAVLPLGKAFGLGTSTSDPHGQCHTKRLDLVFERRGHHRHISCSFRNFGKDKQLFTAELSVYEPDMEAMYIATPWKEKPTAFYYNCKMNCLEAKGLVVLGQRVCSFTRTDTLGVLDWGRGVWTYDNTWYWGTGSGRVNGEAFGFNLGYGFSDRSSASENAIYYQGKIHKLDQVTFHIPIQNGQKQYTSPWMITSNDNRFKGEFVPILDRSACMNFGVIVSDQHQVFGRMNARVQLDNGDTLEINDFICALEIVRNKY